MLRGDGASMTTLGAARDKAYTVFMLGAPRNEDTSGAIAQRMGATSSAGGLAKLPYILLLQGAIRIKVGAEATGAIGVGGAPGGDLDEACAKAGLDKISGTIEIVAYRVGWARRYEPLPALLSCVSASSHSS